MKIVNINGKSIGGEKPSICIPITANSKEEIKKQINRAIKYSPDLLELRIDKWDKEEIKNLEINLEEIKDIAKDALILATYRSEQEGGAGSYNKELIYELYQSIIKSGCVDLIDNEISMGKEYIFPLLKQSKKKKIRTVLSYHNFQETPDEKLLVDKLKEAQTLGGDIAKIAVMPKNPGDILTLLNATLKAEEYMKIPIITISMGSIGKMTRVCSGLFGSILTFCSLDEIESAPGQMDIETLRLFIKELY